MMNKTATIQRTTVDIDTRRIVAVAAGARKPKEVAEVNHETFIRNALKDRMGWPRREPAPETIKMVAKQMAAFLVQRDKDIAEKVRAAAAAKAIAEFKAKHEREANEKRWAEAEAILPA